MKIFLIHTGPYQVNTYLAYDEKEKKAFIVDPGGYSKEISKIIEDEGLTLEYIVLTHGHGDHIGGVEQFKEEFKEAKIVASKEEKNLLSNAGLNMSTIVTGKAVSIDADIWIEDGEKLNCGTSELEFFLTPGHTKGGMVILVGDILFSGDTIFADSIGRTDFPGGSMKELKESIRKKIYTLPDKTKILPGHMGETTVGHEKMYNPFVRN